MFKKQWAKLKNREFWKDESGEFGVKGIAITVAVIVIIGAAVSFIKGSALEGWIGDIWDKFMDLIDNLIK